VSANSPLTKVEQATPDFLTEILRQNGVLSRGRVVTVDHSASTAWNSRSYHLEVRYSDDAQIDASRHLFLKMSKEPEWGKEEVEFYRFVGDKREHLPMLVRCYDAVYREEDGMSHLLLADLSETHITPVTKPQLLAGETMPSQVYLEQMVDAIARFHAYWWQHPQLGNGFARIRNWFDGQDAYKQHTERRHREWATFSEQAGHLIPTHVREIYEQVLSHLPAMWDAYLADRFGPLRGVTLSNGDCYFIQFLCPKMPQEDIAYLIDFDSVSTNLPPYDLVYMFATFWTPAQRNEGGREEKLLRRYHDALVTHGVSDYSWPDLLRDYRLCVLYMIFDPVWDQTSGASEAYWLPKLCCLTGVFMDLDCLSLLPRS
jgi:thiamine kinase-like enzyme